MISIMLLILFPIIMQLFMAPSDSCESGQYRVAMPFTAHGPARQKAAQLTGLKDGDHRHSPRGGKPQE